MLSLRPKNYYQSYKNMQKAIEKLGSVPSKDDYRQVKLLATETCELAKAEMERKLLDSPIGQKFDNVMVIIFEKFAKIFNKIGGHKDNDIGKLLTYGVLVGNILKDLMTGIVSTSQSFTNPDLSKEKRLFMGSYDIMACLTTIALSTLLGPMSLNKINAGYKNILKPLEKIPQYHFVLNGLSAFTTIILQSIIAKRVIAPTVSAPLAGIMKKKLEKN